MRLYTIGFTKTTAEHFFARLRDARVASVLDTRLNRESQLAGFAKGRDLDYFLGKLLAVSYRIEPLLAATEHLLSAYRNREMTWDEYEDGYRSLLVAREAERLLTTGELDGSCLLCSEASADFCHRRVAAEYLRDASGSSAPIEIVHL